ncbi:MAG TPA: response regulator [Candidatus Dormibacteraeota bacterium]|nr:response regulator [Candidatus Dormibacteraeota bacterium]
MSDQSPTKLAGGAPILIADDDANDIFFLRRAFSKAGLSVCVQDVPDGEKAIEYLSGTNSYADRAQFPIPVLLFLDLKMPKINGFEVLEWLRTRSDLPNLKVVVLSSSGLQNDIQKAQALGAHDYRIKPADLGDMTIMVKEVANRWLKPVYL